MELCESCGKRGEEGDRLDRTPFVCRGCGVMRSLALDAAMRRRGYDPISVMAAQMMGLPIPPVVLELYGV